MIEKLEKLFNSEVSAYEIEKQTGVRRGNITDIRNGKRTLDSLTIRTANKLIKFWEELTMKKFTLENIETYVHDHLRENTRDPYYIDFYPSINAYLEEYREEDMEEVAQEVLSQYIGYENFDKENEPIAVIQKSGSSAIIGFNVDSPADIFRNLEKVSYMSGAGDIDHVLDTLEFGTLEDFYYLDQVDIETGAVSFKCGLISEVVCFETDYDVDIDHLIIPELVEALYELRDKVKQAYIDAGYINELYFN